MTRDRVYVLTPMRVSVSKHTGNFLARCVFIMSVLHGVC
jgi:hypothetical protein